MAENVAGLTAEESAYFESGGTTPLATEQETPNEGQEGLQTAPEGLAAPEPEGEKPRDEKGRFVPHQALHAEREEHKKTKAELEEIRRRQAVLEDRWNTILKVGQQPEKPTDEDPEPDPNVDIFAHNQWLARQLNKQREALTAKEKAETEARQAQEAEAAVWNDWHRSAQAYMTQTPEFGDAVKYLSELRDKQLQALSFATPQLRDPQGRVNQINAELKSIIQAAKQQGIDPAEAVYQLAKGWGFTKAAPTPQPAPTVPQMPEKLASVARAQEASKTVGQVNGKSGGDELTLEGLMAMPAAEFEAWVNKNPAMFKKLMGG